ncbi:MAG: glycosyltransferase family 87 protein [Streptomycetales bacterium]
MTVSPRAAWTRGPVSMRDPVPPSRDDPLVAAGSEAVGGPLGHHARAGQGWWTPLRVLLALVTVMFVIGVAQKGYCRDIGWPRDNALQYSHACYSDIPHMFRERGFVDGQLPYLDTGGYPALEYPVLTGAVMTATSWIARTADGVDAQTVLFYDVNAVLMLVLAMVTVTAVVKIAGRRPWDAALVALAPGMLLAGTINWDLLAVAGAMLALLAWTRDRPALAGVLLGLATAAKFYPVLLLGALLVLALRERRVGRFARTAVGAAAAWLVVNLPVMVLAPEGWQTFYTFNEGRSADFGSLWLILEQTGHTAGGLLDAHLNAVTSGLFALLCLGILTLGLRAARPPRLGQLAFLVIAAFVVVNKVYSPQYVLWLIPLAALARPRWRDFLIWQACEVLYFFSVWYYLVAGQDADHALPPRLYWVTIMVRLAGLTYLAATVVRDVLRPECDPVRATARPYEAAGTARPYGVTAP